MDAEPDDVGNEIKREGPVMRKLDGSFSPFVALQGGVEGGVSGRQRIKAHMMVKTGEIDQRLFVELPGRHAISDAFGGIGRQCTDQVPKGLQPLPYRGGKTLDISVHGGRGCKHDLFSYTIGH